MGDIFFGGIVSNKSGDKKSKLNIFVLLVSDRKASSVVVVDVNVVVVDVVIGIVVVEVFVVTVVVVIEVAVVTVVTAVVIVKVIVVVIVIVEVVNVVAVIGVEVAFVVVVLPPSSLLFHPMLSTTLSLSL